jgi:HTH-type transcriptional regulator/antitoxin HipB
MDYPITLSSQLKPHLRSLRKARGLTQAELALRLGVGQSRVADIEANPGAVSVEQLLQILALLQAQVVVREKTQPGTTPVAPSPGVVPAMEPGAAPAARQAPAPRPDADPPQGQW